MLAQAGGEYKKVKEKPTKAPDVSKSPAREDSTSDAEVPVPSTPRILSVINSPTFGVSNMDKYTNITQIRDSLQGDLVAINQSLSTLNTDQEAVRQRLATKQEAARQFLADKQAQQTKDHEEEFRKDKQSLDVRKAGFFRAHSKNTKEIEQFKASMSTESVWEVVDELCGERASKRRKLMTIKRSRWLMTELGFSVGEMESA
jgi:hypothetical protein